MTDHSKDIEELRSRQTSVVLPQLVYPLLADLLEIHDATGISLDNWPAARTLVEYVIGHKIQENGA